MFERFTEPARRTLFFARYETRGRAAVDSPRAPVVGQLVNTAGPSPQTAESGMAINEDLEALKLRLSS